MPKVSIVIPTYNRPELLARALKSVLAQTFQDWEVIVVDDGDHRVRGVVESFHDSRLRYIANEPPRRGGGAARNFGVKTATGEYVAFLDDDDVWLPEKLALQYEAFSKTSADVGFSVTSASVESEQGTHINMVPGEGVHDFADLALTLFKGFLTSTLMIRHEVFDAVGMFDEALPSHQETDLIIRITRRYRGFGIAQPLTTTDMTLHEHIGSDITRRIRGREMLLQKHLDVFKKKPLALAQWYFGLGLYYRDNRQFDKAAHNFKKAFQTYWRLRYVLHYVLCRYASALYGFFALT